MNTKIGWVRNSALRWPGSAPWVAACLLGLTVFSADSKNDQTRAPLHWAFQPVRRAAAPTGALGARNEIDCFIRARLAEHGLAASQEADRRTLIRRLYLDLLGLLPDPAEVEAFEADRRPMAYAELADRLLASPHYGERWARHWLDVVRYAETTGFEMNLPRSNAWPYRDYVIRAFNEDKPYDRFIIEQLAGDVFGVDAGTGFLVGGPDDKVKSPDPVLTANQRADELHDIVSTTSSTFLGLTVGCARCHNHKFDPIVQEDYYAMKAVFSGVQHGERALKTSDLADREDRLAEQRQRLSRIDTQLAAFEPIAAPGQALPRRSPVNPRLNVDRFKPTPAKRLRFVISKTSGAEPCIDELEVYTAEPVPHNIALTEKGTKARASSVFPNSDIHRLEHVNDGRYGNSRSWISNEPGQGWVELEFPEVTTIDRVVWGRDRMQKFTDRLALEYRIELAVGTNDWHAVASSDDRQAYKPGTPAAEANASGLSSGQAAAVKKLAQDRAETETRIAELSKAPMIYAGVFGADPEPIYRLQRGDPMVKGEVIAPGALGMISIQYGSGASGGRFSAEIKGRSLTEDQRRRLALASWMADPAHPLTARVMVNRVWQYHFGEGLVSTPSDFGVNGARPTHPELLDWLAAEFLSSGWSIKALHRLILNSATYRQASAARPDGLAADAGSRLLWRFPPRRLEAEPIRDLILELSGNLDDRMGGAGFSVFEPNENYVRVYEPKREFGSAEWRRMVYATVVRQRPEGVFGVFDCPDGGQIAPKRTRSTTPLQALNLLNSGFSMQQAAFLAKRLETEAGMRPDAQVRRAFNLAFSRWPDADELEAGTALVQSHGLAAFCRALFNANELVFLF